ncbi:hypothetical protein EYF80_027241 [Liparis tanakae]|uniref:Uncharacterized protein n=1 Tax=Liparis tanakae TaxID=230148 RepID=A0A4Z2H9I5_9TELE|nr:hypothetical protein EYF80_027241 [Liparis tanakae]
MPSGAVRIPFALTLSCKRTVRTEGEERRNGLILQLYGNKLMRIPEERECKKEKRSGPVINDL